MSNIKNVVESFFNNGEKIVVGVSGGADSMTLLHCLKSSNKKFNLVAAHLNHCLRGKESLNDENFVREFCKKNNIEFVCKREDIKTIASLKKISIEECGRIKRYEFFESIGGIIATAHTFSDVLETFFLNILRGCGLKGLCSIPQKRKNIIRPLLKFKREEIEEYCFENNLKFVVDSSNFEEKFLRNKIRLNIISKFKEISTCFENKMSKLIDIVKLDEDFLDNVAEKEFEKVKEFGGINVKRINMLHKSIANRIIFKFLKLNKVAATNLMIEKASFLFKKGEGRQQLNKTTNLSLKKGIAYVEKKVCFVPFKIKLNLNPGFCYENLFFVICDVKNYNYFINNVHNLFLFKLDYDKIVGDVYLRNKRGKDRIKLKNRPTKTLKALMQEKRLLQAQKNRTFVLADDCGVFWAFGFGADVRVLPDDFSRNFLLVFEKLKDSCFKEEM